jgi:hypothetical protein
MKINRDALTIDSARQVFAASAKKSNAKLDPLARLPERAIIDPARQFSRATPPAVRSLTQVNMNKPKLGQIDTVSQRRRSCQSIAACICT